MRDALDNIYDARVPEMWKRSSWVSTTLGFWYTELLERNTQFRNWCFLSRPVAFWMTGFFNPQGKYTTILINKSSDGTANFSIFIGFLTAMRQEVARAHKGWALDQVVLHNDVTKLNKEDARYPPAVRIFNIVPNKLFISKKGKINSNRMPKIKRIRHCAGSSITITITISYYSSKDLTQVLLNYVRSGQTATSETHGHDVSAVL